MPKIKKKEKREAILYARISADNKKWLHKTWKKMNYRSEAEFVEELITQARKDFKK